MLLDIINNVLLHKEPSKKESLDRMNKMKFSLQLSNIEDYQALILSRQEKVRYFGNGNVYMYIFLYCQWCSGTFGNGNVSTLYSISAS